LNDRGQGSETRIPGTGHQSVELIQVIKCSHCGTGNSEASKFCRECGKLLAAGTFDLGIIEEEIEQSPMASVQEKPDDAAVAELLYETLKLYEQEKLEAAFAKCKEALRMNPNSPSGHSLLGLIYEKKAEEEIHKDNKTDAEDYLRAAMRQIERVIEANPDSIADREKLQDLRAMLSGLSDSQLPRQPALHVNTAAILRRVPMPWAAAVLAFVSVFILIIISTGGGGSKRAKAQPEASQAASQPTGQPPTQPATPQPSGANPDYPNQSPTLSGQAWSYEPQQSALPPKIYLPDSPVTTEQPPVYAQPHLSAPPTPLPPMVVPTAVLLPPPPTPEPPKVEQPVVVPPKPPEEPPAVRARAAYIHKDYESASALYTDAIHQGADSPENNQSLGMCYYKLGNKPKAIESFEHAIKLYTDQKAKGVNSDSADAGMRTCKSYIDILRSGG